MGFRQIRFFNFRNLENQSISVDTPELFLVGENGQGKSNFLEAVYMLCYGGSFRTKSDDQLCRWEESQMVVEGDLTTTEGEEQRITYRVDERKKQIALNGKAVSDRKELVHIMPCIVFCHDDIQFVKGAPDMQRYFFDQTLSLYDPMFIDVLRRYRKILRLRNNVLKAADTTLLPVYDHQLAVTGVELQAQRQIAVENFNKTFAQLFTRISGLQDELSIVYRPSWKGEGATEAVERKLSERRGRDLYMGTTTSGPHRDRFIFMQSGRNFTDTASTGQIRLVSLILRVAQAVFFSEQANRRPVLLLDDVMLELDPTRRSRFLASLPRYEQAFYTFLPDEQFSSYIKDDTVVYTVQAGSIHETRR